MRDRIVIDSCTLEFFNNDFMVCSLFEKEDNQFL